MHIMFHLRKLENYLKENLIFLREDEIFGAQFKNFLNFQNPSNYNSNLKRHTNLTNSTFMDNSSNFGIKTDYEMLEREFVQLNQKLNYVMDSIKTFWSPELKKERQLRKEEALRINTLQYKLCQQAVIYLIRFLLKEVFTDYK